jgi:hypothetical protein
MSPFIDLSQHIWGFAKTGGSTITEQSVQAAANQASKLGPIVATWYQYMLINSDNELFRMIKVPGARDNGLDLSSSPVLLRRNVEQSYSPDASDVIAGMFLELVPGTQVPPLSDFKKPNIDAIELHLLLGVAVLEPAQSVLIKRMLFRRSGSLTRLGKKLSRRFPGLEGFLRAKLDVTARKVNTLQRFVSRLPKSRPFSTTSDCPASEPLIAGSIDQIRELLRLPKIAAALANAVVIVIPSAYEESLLAVLSHHPAKLRLVPPSVFRAMVGHINPPTGEGVTMTFARRMLTEIGLQTTSEDIYLVYLELSPDSQLESVKILNAVDRTLLLTTQQVHTSQAVRSSITDSSRMVHGAEALALCGEGLAANSRFLMDVLVASASTESERASVMWKVAGVLWESGDKQAAVETFRMGTVLAPGEPIMGILPDGLVAELKKLGNPRLTNGNVVWRNGESRRHLSKGHQCVSARVIGG